MHIFQACWVRVWKFFKSEACQATTVRLQGIRQANEIEDFSTSSTRALPFCPSPPFWGRGKMAKPLSSLLGRCSRYLLQSLGGLLRISNLQNWKFPEPCEVRRHRQAGCRSASRFCGLFACRFAGAYASYATDPRYEPPRSEGTSLCYEDCHSKTSPALQALPFCPSPLKGGGAKWC